MENLVIWKSSHMENLVIWKPALCGCLVVLALLGLFCSTALARLWFEKIFSFVEFAAFKHLHCTAQTNPKVRELRLAII